MDKNTYVDVAYEVVKRQSGGREPYAAAVGDLARRLRPVVDQLHMMERAELVGWLCAPLSELQGQSPAELIALGKWATVAELLRGRSEIT